MRTMIVTWVFAAVTCFATVSTGNEPPNPEAVETFKKGATCYKLLRWDCAISEWQKSYQAFSSPVTLFNLAQAYRQAGDAERALMSYKLYLGDSPDGTYKDAAQAMIQKLEPLVEQARQSKKAPPLNAAKPDSDKPNDPARPTGEKHEEPAKKPPVTESTPRESSEPPTSVVSKSGQVDTPVYRKPALWVGVVVGLVVVGAVVGLAVAFTTPSNATPPSTSLGGMKFNF